MSIYPPNYETPLGQLRALLFQTVRYVDPANPELPADYLVPDEQLNVFIALNSGIYGAASDALIALATNEALVSKKIRTEGGLQTDGPAVAQRLLDLAKEYRKRQDDEDDAAGADASFEIINFTEFYPSWPIR